MKQTEPERIAEGLIRGVYATNPHEAAQDAAILAGEFSFIMGQLESILQRKPAVWNAMRPNFKSDTACERAFQATKDGLDEQGLKLRAKGLEKMMSALRSLIRLAETDYHNQR